MQVHTPESGSASNQTWVSPTAEPCKQSSPFSAGLQPPQSPASCPRGILGLGVSFAACAGGCQLKAEITSVPSFSSPQCFLLMGDSLPRVGQGDKDRVEFRMFAQLKCIVGWVMRMGWRDSVTSGASTSLWMWVAASPMPQTQLLHNQTPFFLQNLHLLSSWPLCAGSQEDV